MRIAEKILNRYNLTPDPWDILEKVLPVNEIELLKKQYQSWFKHLGVKVLIFADNSALRFNPTKKQWYTLNLASIYYYKQKYYDLYLKEIEPRAKETITKTYDISDTTTISNWHHILTPDNVRLAVKHGERWYLV